MSIEDLLARFKPRENQMQPTNEVPGAARAATSTLPGLDEPPKSMSDLSKPPRIFQDNFQTNSPITPTEAPLSFQQIGMPGQGQQQPSQQFSAFQAGVGGGGSEMEARLERMEEKLKILCDKIDLMAQQVSVVWEIQRRKM